MTFIDAIIVVLLIWAAVSGLRQGLIAAAVGLEAFAGDVIGSALRTAFSCALLVCSAILVVVAVARWLSVERAMRTQRPLPLPWASFLLAGLLATAGVGLAVAIAV